MDMDERYATFREHAELREWTAKIDASVQQIPSMLARIENKIDTQRAPPVDHQALTAHRVLDELPQILQAARSQTQGVSPILIGFAIIGAMAIGALTYRIVTGG